MPSPATLKKYGLTQEEWDAIFKRQDSVCAICGKLPKSGRLNVDHVHVPKYKELSPECRKSLVRGLLCYVCNHRILTRGVTVEKLENAVNYLKDFERRRDLIK